MLGLILDMSNDLQLLAVSGLLVFIGRRCDPKSRASAITAVTVGLLVAGLIFVPEGVDDIRENDTPVLKHLIPSYRRTANREAYLRELGQEAQLETGLIDGQLKAINSYADEERLEASWKRLAQMLSAQKRLSRLDQLDQIALTLVNMDQADWTQETIVIDLSGKLKMLFALGVLLVGGWTLERIRAGSRTPS